MDISSFEVCYSNHSILSTDDLLKGLEVLLDIKFSITINPYSVSKNPEKVLLIYADRRHRCSQNL